MEKPRIYAMRFAAVYPLYVQKAEKKGRAKQDVDEIIGWLTGQIQAGADMETFFTQAPLMNPNRALITGVMCGVRVEAVEDEVMRNIRYLDKLIDELAKGKAMKKILRG